jgi:hypothetical protein
MSVEVHHVVRPNQQGKYSEMGQAYLLVFISVTTVEFFSTYVTGTGK